MPEQFFLLLAAVVFLMALGRGVVVRRRGQNAEDWELMVAFIRLEFPAEQRDIAQKIAAGMAQLVGSRIKRLRPEHTLEQIVGWAENPIHINELIKVLYAAYGIQCYPASSFRLVVEKIAERWLREQPPAP